MKPAPILDQWKFDPRPFGLCVSGQLGPTDDPRQRFKMVGQKNYRPLARYNAVFLGPQGQVWTTVYQVIRALNPSGHADNSSAKFSLRAADRAHRPWVVVFGHLLALAEWWDGRTWPDPAQIGKLSGRAGRVWVDGVEVPNRDTMAKRKAVWRAGMVPVYLAGHLIQWDPPDILGYWPRGSYDLEGGRKALTERARGV